MVIQSHEEQVAYWRDTVRGELVAEIERLLAELKVARAERDALILENLRLHATIEQEKRWRYERGAMHA
jgi:hypothetical protein